MNFTTEELLLNHNGCLENAGRLLLEAELLASHQYYNRAGFLIVTLLEELVRAAWFGGSYYLKKNWNQGPRCTENRAVNKSHDGKFAVFMLMVGRILSGPGQHYSEEKISQFLLEVKKFRTCSLYFSPAGNGEKKYYSTDSKRSYEEIYLLVHPIAKYIFSHQMDKIEVDFHEMILKIPQEKIQKVNPVLFYVDILFLLSERNKTPIPRIIENNELRSNT